MRDCQFTRPPELRQHDTKTFEFGPLKVFYHSTFPLDNPTQELTWNFYFGRSGKGVEGVIEIQDLEKWEIQVRMQGLNKEWSRTGLFLATPLKEVIVEFPEGLVQGAPTVDHMIVFPPDPRKGRPMEIHGLKYVL